MKLEILPDAEAVAREAARRVAGEARDCVAARGRFVFAVSGGSTPWKMLEALDRVVRHVPFHRPELTDGRDGLVNQLMKSRARCRHC